MSSMCKRSREWRKKRVTRMGEGGDKTFFPSRANKKGKKKSKKWKRGWGWRGHLQHGLRSHKMTSGTKKGFARWGLLKTAGEGWEVTVNSQGGKKDEKKKKLENRVKKKG